MYIRYEMLAFLFNLHIMYKMSIFTYLWLTYNWIFFAKSRNKVRWFSIWLKSFHIWCMSLRKAKSGCNRCKELVLRWSISYVSICKVHNFSSKYKLITIHILLYWEWSCRSLCHLGADDKITQFSWSIMILKSELDIFFLSKYLLDYLKRKLHLGGAPHGTVEYFFTFLIACVWVCVCVCVLPLFWCIIFVSFLIILQYFLSRINRIMSFVINQLKKLV